MKGIDWNDTDLPPKPTEYGGTEYRSALEAKTAAAFDNLGIPYVYEIDGFKLRNGMWYKPDFWLPDARMYVECKGVMDDEASAKIIGLVEEYSRPVLVLSYSNAVLVFKDWIDESYGTAEACGVVEMLTCAKCGTTWFSTPDGSYKCPKCYACDGDHHLKRLEVMESGTALFRLGQAEAAKDPKYTELTKIFNETNDKEN